ncbi:hypothetical protein MP638_003558 [Amoeboaphelidium occidentale]|nr:hypothetical protein MP638_003558 [Amoeboaphelidium occidentale]
MTNDTKIHRPVFKVINIDDATERLTYFPSEDATGLIKVGDEGVLLDSFTVCGQSIFTLIKLDKEQRKQYVADFLAHELQPVEERKEVEYDWLMKEREILLQGQNAQKKEE